MATIAEWEEGKEDGDHNRELREGLWRCRGLEGYGWRVHHAIRLKNKKAGDAGWFAAREKYYFSL